MCLPGLFVRSSAAELADPSRLQMLDDVLAGLNPDLAPILLLETSITVQPNAYTCFLTSASFFRISCHNSANQ